MAVRFRAKTETGTINSLVHPFQYPGGEWDIKVPTGEVPLDASVTNTQNILDDIAILSLWADWVRSQGHKVSIKMPYLPAARADKGLPMGGGIYATLLNSIHADEIFIFDPHSPVIPNLVNQVKVIDSQRIIKNHVFGKSGYSSYTGIIAPDEGAVNRATAVAQTLRLPVYQARKVRDFDTGKILDYDPYEIKDAPHDGRYLVVDDICDGGGTFKFLAEKTGLSREQLSLWVSHGIFSGKANELNEYYGQIYTTNSVQPLNDIGAQVININSYLNDLYTNPKKEDKS